MDKQRVASELVKIARDLTAKTGFRDIDDALNTVSHHMKSMANSHKEAAMHLGRAERSSGDVSKMIINLSDAASRLQNLEDSVQVARRFVKEALKEAEGM